LIAFQAKDLSNRGRNYCLGTFRRPTDDPL